MISTVGDLVDLGAERSPTRIAVKLRGGPGLSYATLRERTNRLANGLLAHGLRPGDRVGAWMDDELAYVELYLAAAKAGLVLVPINARLLAREAVFQLADAGVRALCWSEGVDHRVPELAGADDGLLHITTAASPSVPAIGFASLIAGGADVRPAPPDPGALYVLAYTSGTTGVPKGAMLTHRSVLAIARLNAHAYRLPPYSVAAVTGSMSFPAVVPAHVISHLYVGGTAIVMGPWDVETLVDTVDHEQVTFTYLPTPYIADFTALARRVPDRWRSLQSVLHSASRAAPSLRRALCEVVGDRFVEGWGMTENSGGLMTATTRADVADDVANLHATAGRAVPETLVDVVDADGAPVPHDGETMGELRFRGPALMAGYWKRPEATERALRGGWMHTGDLGTIDAGGYVTVTERRTDLIVSGGMNVYPSEVEHCIARLDGVRECVVVAAPHERWGQTVVAVVIGSSAVTETQVIEHCRRELASYKKPTRVLFVDDVPRTASLKVKRAEVREDVARLLADPVGDAA